MDSASRDTSRSHTVDPQSNAKLYSDTPPTSALPRRPLALQSVPSSPTCYSCPETKVLNSRRKKRPGFAVKSIQESAQPTPQFVQPSKVYNRSRFPGTPQYPNRGPRQKQIQLQPSKSELSKPGSRRDKLKPYVLEPPVQAQRYPKSIFCDFYPWKGTHQEDHVTDAQARNGQYDKLFVGKNNSEQASARPLLGPAFKQRMGLRTLSSLYLSILDKRQLYSTVTTASTFKPPPRVTLPDPRREAWLRDLASPSVPLRRLSRTIPHGLKGPALLDQCAAKNVSTARAVWFVRCVGANELRGLRRKGVGSLALGGEAKWIKEWTGQVMQFLEKTITTCGTMPDDQWHARMHYSLRLATHLYAENLLDRTVFLEWFLSFLQSCTLDVLPLALVLATVFWEDLLKLKRFSRRLAEVLMHKSEAVMSSDDSLQLLPLIRRLSTMTSNLLFSHRESLVGSGEWKRLEKTLALADGRFASTEICLQNVTRRNNNFDGSKASSDSTSAVSARRKAVDYLDSVTLPFDAVTIFQQLNMQLNRKDIVPCIFEWSVTTLRTGPYRVYLGAELLRLASQDSLNIQVPIMEFLGRLELHTKVKEYDVYLLVSELVRTELFSIAVFMRWLIAKGGIKGLGEGSPCYVRLLAEIPIHAARAPLRNLRSILLEGYSFDLAQEERSVVDTREMLSMRGMFNMLHTTQADRYTGLSQNELESIRSLSRTAKSEVALWIKDSFELLAARELPGRDSWRNASLDARVHILPVAQVILIRQVLEEMGDLAVLVEIIKIVLSSDNWDVLTLVSNTISYNYEAFSVLHPIADLEQRLFHRYKELKIHQPFNKPFAAAFLELLSSTRKEGPMKQELEYDLETFELHNPRSQVARSPISETMDDIFDDGDMENNEEIDRLWHTGASVDRDNLSRLFETTVSKMETSFEDPDNQSHILSAARGLSKLRQFDSEDFGQLSRSWVFRMKNYSNRVPLFRAFSSLIPGACLRIEALTSVAANMLSQHQDGAISAFDGGMFVSMVVNLIVHENPFETSLSAKDLYTLKRKRKQYIASNGAEALTLFRNVIELCSIAQDNELHQQVVRLLSSGPALELLRGFAIRDMELLKAQIVDPLLQAGKPSFMSWLQLLVDNLLDDNDSNDNTEVDAHVQVARLLDLANDFSIGLCKLKMQIILNVGTSSTAFNDGALANTIARSFVRGIASASDDRRKICTDLVTVLNKDTAGKIRADVEGLFLDWNAFLRTRQLIEQLDLSLTDNHENGESLARAFLAVVEATAVSGGAPGGIQFNIAQTLVERMVKLLQMISGNDEDGGVGAEMSVRSREARAEFRCWFVLFMRLVVMHRAAFTQAKSSMSDQARMLAGLCCLLQHDLIRNDEAHFEFVLSVAGSFCDGLPDDTRLQLKRYGRGKRAPSMAAYLVGTGDGGETLKALQRGKAVEYAVKPWERLAEPTPSMGENDVSLSLALFRTRRF